MQSPITGKEMLRLSRKKTIIYQGSEFEIEHHYCLCDSGEEYVDEESSQKNLEQIIEKISNIKYNL